MSDRREEMWGAVRKSLAEAQTGAPIEHATGLGPPPLSHTQEGIWLFEQMHPDAGAYNTTHALNIDGPLNIEVLRSSIEVTVNRHEILRTSIGRLHGTPVQQIADDVTVHLEFVDVTHLSEQEQTQTVRRLAHAENSDIFDLGRQPLWRFTLLRLAEDAHVLLMKIHHVVWDHTSYGIFVDEVRKLYAAAVSGTTPDLPALSIQFSDFARWQRNRTAEGRLRPHIEYWTRTLSGCTWNVNLPFDSSRPHVSTCSGRSVWIHLDSELHAGIKQLSRTCETTPYATLMAALVAVLARYGNDPDVVVAAPFSLRRRPELISMIGPLVNLLLLRFDVRGNPNAAELLRRVRRVLLEGHIHQDAPYEEVLARLERDRDRVGRLPVQAMLTLYRMPDDPVPAGDLRITPADVDDGKSRMDLELFAWEANDGLHGRFIFNSDLFEHETMERISGHYRNLLVGMVADPTIPLSRLPMLTKNERRHLLVEWCANNSKEPTETSIHRLFETQVARAPRAPALIGDGQTLTYGELNAHADRLAHQLLLRGVHAGDLVAVYLERDTRLIIALISILKLGAAYVPLDQADPPDRTSGLLADCGADLLLTTETSRERIQYPDIDIILIEDLPEPTSDPSAWSLHEEGDLAYVTYTSGSTGRPKGIAVPHRAVIDTVKGTDYIDIMPGDRVAQAANVTFDVATSEIWGALLNGGTLVVIPLETILSPPSLAAALKSLRIDTLFLTTALFHRVASEIPGAFSGVRDLLVGGEVLDPNAVRRVLASDPPARLINVYGPTEATAYSTWYSVETMTENVTRIPVGAPIGRTRVYVLTGELKPAPVGVVGEIYLAGPSLAWGYVDQPGPTATCFIPNPFAEEGGQRLYRTGDLGRWRNDGLLDFVDRMDTQVKIRGHRIELREIETTLVEHPAVRECAVTSSNPPGRGVAPNDQVLIAHIIPTPGQRSDVDILRQFAKRKLPRYMVPSTWRTVDSLPITPSGKVDRRALNNQVRDRTQPDTTFAAPHTEIERQLLDIWERVLWVEADIGVHDDFFDLGGHSLLAATLVAEIEQALDVKIPIPALFRLTTVSDLAGHLEPMIEALSESLKKSLVDPDLATAATPHRLPDEIRHRLLSYTSGWRGDRVSPDVGLMVGHNLGGFKTPLFWCLQSSDELQQLATHLGHNQPVYGMRSGYLAMQFTAQNILGLADEYVGEILAVEPVGPYLIGGNCQGVYIAWAIAEELRRRDRSVALLLLQLMDYRHALPYAGRVALFVGTDTTDPYRLPASEEPSWADLYPGGFTMDSIPGTHRWHFAEPHVGDFTTKIAHRIEHAMANVSVARNPPNYQSADHPRSRGVIVLGTDGSGASEIGDVFVRLWDRPSRNERFRKVVTEIHDDFLASSGCSADDPVALKDAVAHGQAAVSARMRLREVIDDLSNQTRWLLDDPRMATLFPLWTGLFPRGVDIHFVLVFRSPDVDADLLASRHKLRPDRSLFRWLVYYLDAEMTTRDRYRSWFHTESFVPPPPNRSVAAIRVAAGLEELDPGQLENAVATVHDHCRISKPTGSLETIRETLQYQPWITTLYRALIGFTEGREIESRVTLDALRFGLDNEKRSIELERIQTEYERIREKSHHVWQESLRAREENQDLRQELDQIVSRLREESQVALRNAQQEHDAVRRSMEQQLYDFQQRRSWKLTAPLRWLFSLIGRGNGIG